MDRLNKVVGCRYLETVDTVDELELYDDECIITMDCSLNEVLGTFLYNGFMQSEIIKALQRNGLQVDYKWLKIAIFYVKEMDMYYAINEAY